MKALILTLLCVLLPAQAQFLTQENYNTPIRIGHAYFVAEVVDTPQTMARGMMFRSHMTDRQAMIFVFSRPKRVNFWMKNTLIALDMLFFAADGQLLEIKHRVQPCRSSPCPTYPSRSRRVQFVIELKAGSAKKYALKRGDKLHVLSRKRPTATSRR
ncbi:MAG: hypothetical protein CR974_02435 [Gammaproteobacteria bacterium]|nr:MAG: hypothetical protein CR974_02435 [Gammaproteobacteria bacterium]